MLRPLPPDLRSLIDAQAGVVARRQLLRSGFEWEHVASRVSSGRWAERTPRVVSTVTGQLTLEQRQWVAVLHAGPRSMLGGLSAAGRHGLEHWPRETITVLVDDELSFAPVPGVEFFRSRRPADLLRSSRPGVPTCQLEPAVLLWAAYSASVRAAHGLLAAAVQQRLSTAARLGEWVDRLAPLRRARSFRRTLTFVEGGAQSGAEIEVARMCRRCAMPAPQRQVPRLDRTGKRRWTDAEWELDEGTTVVLEVDGSFHLEVRQAADDARRSRRLVARTRFVVRCTAYELTHEPDEVAADLIALGVPGRLPQGRVPQTAL